MASITCPNCQNVAAAGTTTCPGCGSSLSGGVSQATGTPPPPPPSSSPPPFTAGTSKPQIKFDLKSVSHVDRLVGGGSLVLFISLFLPWFHAKGPFGGSVDALDPHGYLYITLILSIAIVLLVGAEILGIWKLPASSSVSRDQILLIATTINFVLILIGFIFKPSGGGVVSVGWSFGAFVGLIAAIVAVFPLGWPIIQARRGK
jgi:hypothetical protein